MKYTFPYYDVDRVRHVIEVEADDFDEALDLAVAEFYRREPLT